MAKKYGYARVSSRGQNLEDQIDQITEFGVDEIFSEHYTGTTTNRPQFDLLNDVVQTGDTIVVTKLDRIARTVGDGAKIIDGWLAKNISVEILNMGRLDNTTIGALTRNVMLAFAQFERDMIVERTQEGRVKARLTRPDYVEGRPLKYHNDQRRHAASLLIDEGYSFTQVEKMTGISRSTLQRIKRVELDRRAKTQENNIK
ncbi:recombinase family protein [Weissella confusa]|uniref:recombinase family protein n=1 Tax=Weissella confusa TaxID=1583 RepID=UPI001C6F95B7|nr:recombinase family protein [Weissella confusa]QYU56739.1 recombinase family protein [Weissella confusa]